MLIMVEPGKFIGRDVCIVTTIRPSTVKVHTRAYRKHVAVSTDNEKSSAGLRYRVGCQGIKYVTHLRILIYFDLAEMWKIHLAMEMDEVGMALR